MLTLALITALSSEKASAQDRMQPQTQLRDNGYFTGMVGKWHIGYEPAGQVERYGLLQNDHGQIVQNDHGQTNSLVPIAGVNRSVPLAGGSENVNSVFDCRPNIMNPSGSNLHHDFVDYIMHPADDSNFILDDMPFLELDSPLLPRHGR